MSAPIFINHGTMGKMFHAMAEVPGTVKLACGPRLREMTILQTPADALCRLLDFHVDADTVPQNQAGLRLVLARSLSRSDST
jgi:hypothetical protein